MSDLQHSNALPQRSFYTETALQLIKDFASYNVTLAFPEVPESDEMETLSHYLKPVVLELLRSDKSKMMQIIYRVDITERALGRELEAMSLDESAEKLTRLIVERERLKVELRRRYS